MISIKDRAPLHPGRVQLNPVTGQPNIFDLMRADNPTEVGTALNRRTMQLLRADIRTLPIAAGNTVTAGDVVDVVGGEVQKTLQGNANAKTVFSNASTSGIATCKLTDTTFVSCFNSASQYGIARVGNIINGIVSFAGNSPQFNSQNPTNIACARLSDTRFVVMFAYGLALYVMIGTVNGVDITFSSQVQISASSTNFGSLIPISDSSFLSIYNPSGLKAKVCTVSGTTITADTEYSLSGSTNTVYISATRLPDDGSNRRVCVCYSDAGDSNKGKAVIATINASNVVTWGTPVVFEGIRLTYPVRTSCASYGDYVFVAYRPESGGTSTFAKTIMASGSTISQVGPEFDNGLMNTSTVSMSVVDAKPVLAYSVSNTARAMVLTRSGTVLSGNQEFTFNTAAASPAVAIISSDKLLLCFADGANSAYGTATLLTVKGDQIAGSFVDASSQAIALQPGTEGQSIDIIYDGVAELSDITAGTQITSAGVQGYAPQDGWLWVRPEWDVGAKIEIGQYTGTGTYGSENKNTLTFSLEPKFLIISRRQASPPEYGSFCFIVPKTGGLAVVNSNLSATSTINVYPVLSNVSGSSVSWYSGGSADVQQNLSNRVYDYTCFC